MLDTTKAKSNLAMTKKILNKPFNTTSTKVLFMARSTKVGTVCPHATKIGTSCSWSSTLSFMLTQNQMMAGI